MTVCCPCDALIHPAKPDIPAGLPALPRQLAGFPEYRLAMLHDIPTYAPLAGWRAREGDDLGLMLLEMGAYVLDLLGFYDERIADESYLRTAVLRPSLRKLVGLIGYQARPALAASVVLAAIADGNRPVVLPPRTGFRSDAFAGAPPQVFETEVEHTIHALKNAWPLGPVRERFPGDELLLEASTAALTAGQPVLLRWTRPGPAGPTTALRAGRVTSTRSINALDGATYVRVEIAPAPEFDPQVELGAIDILSPRLTASVNPLEKNPIENLMIFPQPSQTQIILDALYPQLSEQDPVVVQCGKELHAALITAVSTVHVEVRPGTESVPPGTESVPPATLPATSVRISPGLLPGLTGDPLRLVIHLTMAAAGRLTSVAKTHVDVADFALPGVPVEGVIEPLPAGVAQPSELLLLDAQDNGARANGSVDINLQGEGTVQLAPDMPPFDPMLRTPVTVFGNLVRATRGESVFNEVLGSGDASQTLQSFTLGNKPLTYLNDPSAPNGRRSTLEVRVNGITWREVSSFFATGPLDEAYIVRQNDAQEAVVTFGDGTTGARLPTGVDNITATYRFGAGAAKPPAGAIGQLARPVEGLRRVVNPVAAGGGADADQPKDIRRNAPNSALLLGRAVSIPDFEALAREFGGVINAHVEWAWDETTQGAVVKAWFISDGGDIAKALRAFLIGQADPNTPLVAEEAKAQPSQLSIDLEIDPRFNTQIVIEQVKQALTNPDTGILALEHIPIGCPLFRSRIFDAVLSVAGTRSVRAMTVDGQPAPFAITVVQGWYRDFLDGLVIGGTQAP
jgi:hypothetical protein